MSSFDVISVGRVSVDLYSMEPDVSFREEQQFFKSIGGSPTNVAVAAARLGEKAALVTNVGSDDFGHYVLAKLQSFGVDTRFVGIDETQQTPLALAALTPPESPQVVFYRGPEAPDTKLIASQVPVEEIEAAKILWISQTSLAKEPTATTCLTWMKSRERKPDTILDLDYRPTLWKSESEAREMATRAIELATVVVGNREEIRVALGIENADDAADELLRRGVRLAIIKLGAEGSLFATEDERILMPSSKVDVVCGLGAGDAFGGALCHGILAGWDISKIGNFANAAGAIVSSRLTCADAMPSVSELEQMLGAAA